MKIFCHTIFLNISPLPKYVKIHEDVLASPVLCLPHPKNVFLPGGGLLLLHGMGKDHHCTALLGE